MNEIVPNLDYAAYCAAPGLRGSSIVNMRRSPMYYWHCLRNPRPETPAQALGTATHRILLEPGRIDETVTWGEAEDQKVRRGKVWDAFQAQHAGKMIVTRAEREHMDGITERLHDSPVARKYLIAAGQTELSLFWNDIATGRRMKCRIDKLIRRDAPSTPFIVDGEDYAEPKKGRPDLIVDLKTARSSTPYKFGAQAYALGYHIKAYLYVSGYKAITGRAAEFRWIAVESKPPYESAVYRATSDILLQGAEDLDKLLQQLDECERTNTWPPALEEETDLTLPSYAFNQAPDTELFLEM